MSIDHDTKHLLGSILFPLISEIDLPHGHMHSIDLSRIVRHTCRNLPLDSFEEILLDTAAIIHDLGLAVTLLGENRDDHPAMSVVITDYLGMEPDIPINQIISNHDRDVLNPDSGSLTRIFRDLDRISRTGYIGIIIMSYYLGFRHDLMNDAYALSPTRDASLIDIPNSVESPPPWENVVYDSLTPYLLKSGKINEMVAQLELLLSRIDGCVNPETKEFMIEPIMPELAVLWKNRIDESKLYLQELKIIADSSVL